eukprot:gnl/TRDRNA2_/TRDRNA2_178711_c0_seq1.p1 gnl/TRDRNA2_/TRDRNA2_178711_c0~~gnl/TRDRNA2_/TRDRNA2_178711_c0_seq1.p1  ORF type:complete len:281 (+),score=62.31 gnl/TRDRNA2_/TRDRNA2_178711_c0_seq1:99-941(+)
MAPKNVSPSPCQRLFLSSWPGFLCITFGLVSYCALLPSDSPAYTAKTTHTHRQKPTDVTNLLQHGTLVTKRALKAEQAAKKVEQAEAAAAPKRSLRGGAAAVAAGAAEATAQAAELAQPDFEERHLEKEPVETQVAVPAWHDVMQEKAKASALQTDAKSPKTDASRSRQKVSGAHRKQPQTPQHAMHAPHTEAEKLQQELQLLQTTRKVAANRSYHKIRNKALDDHTPAHAAWDEHNHQAMHEWSKKQTKKSKSRNAHHAVRKYSKAPMDPHHHAPEEHH